MKKSATPWCIVGAMAAVSLFQLAVAAPASAQAPCYGYGGGGWGAPYYGMYSIYTMRRIPYYAEHPPVYYSRPVPRTYGYSPYAYPPGVMTPELAPEPELTVNPYIPEDQRPPRPVSTKQGKMAKAPPRTANPFVNTQGEDTAQPTGAKSAATKSASLRIEPVTLVVQRPANAS
ncbi:MAG: hypothetical protein KDA63_02800 [Planctomycetales bacterium]|nr:hypothetical protein [Planctomycetales bacterium]